MLPSPLLSRLSRSRGFSLVEMMVVVVIIAMLMALAVVGTQFAFRKGSEDKARQQIKALELGIESYNSDNSEYPKSPTPNGSGTPDQPGSQDLYVALTGDKNMNGKLEDEEQKLIGTPYLPELLEGGAAGGKTIQGWVVQEGQTRMIVDPFGEEYQYRSPGEENALYDIWSYGSDTTKRPENQAKWIKNW